MKSIGNRCCFCGSDLGEWGNNPHPLTTKDDRRCCDACNDIFVIPARLGILHSVNVEELTRIADSDDLALVRG